MKQWLAGSVLGALAMFVLGFLFWGTPVGVNAFGHLSPAQEAALAATLGGTLEGHATYALPDMRNGTAADTGARHRAGPLAIIHFRAAGAPAMDPAVMLMGFLHMLLTAGVMGLALLGVRDRLPAWGARARLMALLGVAAGIYMHLGNPIWFYEDWTFALMTFGYDTVSFIVAGCILAGCIRPAR